MFFCRVILFFLEGKFVLVFDYVFLQYGMILKGVELCFSCIEANLFGGLYVFFTGGFMSVFLFFMVGNGAGLF